MPDVKMLYGITDCTSLFVLSYPPVTRKRWWRYILNESTQA